MASGISSIPGGSPVLPLRVGDPGARPLESKSQERVLPWEVFQPQVRESITGPLPRLPEEKEKKADPPESTAAIPSAQIPAPAPTSAVPIRIETVEYYGQGYSFPAKDGSVLTQPAPTSGAPKAPGKTFEELLRESIASLDVKQPSAEGPETTPGTLKDTPEILKESTKPQDILAETDRWIKDMLNNWEKSTDKAGRPGSDIKTPDTKKNQPFDGYVYDPDGDVFAPEDSKSTQPLPDLPASNPFSWGSPFSSNVGLKGRYSGSWDDYTKVIDDYNSEVQRPRAQEMARESSRGGVFGLAGMGLAMMRGSGVRTPPPPPLIPQNEALEVWKNRHAAELGVMLTPPLGEIRPEVKKSQDHIAEMVDKLAGDKLEEKGIKVRVNIYSGDVLNAFAQRSSDEWRVTDGNNVSAKAARLNSSIATLRPVLDPDGSGQPIYEIGVTAGALAKLQNQDELAFLLGHELTHLLEGHMEPMGGSWLSSQSNEAVADHESFRMMVKAGYDPEMGLLLLNRLHEGQEAPPMEELLGALSSGAAAHHHEGVRVALGQIKLEQLRRTDLAAQPRTEHQPLPEYMKTLGTSEKMDVDYEKKLEKATLELAQGYLTQPLVGSTAFCGAYGLEPADAKDKAVKGLFEAPYEPKTAGRIYNQALQAIEVAPADSQTKVDAALLLFQRLSEKGWANGGPPDLSEVSKDVAGFFARHTAPAQGEGWKADGFLSKLSATNAAKEPESAFALKVLGAPGFQEGVAPIYKDCPELVKLFEAAPDLLAKPASSYVINNNGLAVAAGVLAGKQVVGDSRTSLGWPKDVPAGKGALDDVLRKNLAQYVARQSATEGWKNHAILNALMSNLKEAPNQAFVSQMESNLGPVKQAVQAQQEADIETAFSGRSGIYRLTASARALPLSQAQRDQLAQNFLASGGNGPDIQFQYSPDVGRAFAQILDSPTSTPLEKQTTANYMLKHMPSMGLGQDLAIPGLAALNRYIGSQDKASLLATVKSEVSRNGLGTPPPRRDTNSFSMDGISREENPNPTASVIGNHRALSKEVAAELDPTQLNAWLADLKRTHNGIDYGTRLLLMDSFIHHQDKETDISAWHEKYTALTSKHFLDGRPDLRESLSSHLYPALSQMEPAQIKEWLNKSDVQTILKTDQTAELLSKLVGPQDPAFKGQPEALAKKLSEVDKEFKLEDRPALRRSLHERIAEQGRLQPHDMDIVLPVDVRSVSDQAAALNKEIRGLSAMVAAVRTREPKEQLEMVEYLMGRRPQAPAFIQDLDQEIREATSFSSVKLSDVFDETRRYLVDADQGVRTAVATSFLAGPSGILHNPEGRQMLLEHFTEPVRGQNKPLAQSLARVLLEAHGSQDSLAVGYLLAQKSEGGRPLSEGEVLNSLFDAYGVPGIKLKQYLAFTSDFKEFRHNFESSQDSAMPLSYLQAVNLAKHHYGDNWPKDWEVKDVLGSGSVNVALRFLDHKDGQTKVVSLPREQVETCSDYDFWRMDQFLDLFTKDADNQKKYGFLRGLTGVIRDSVTLEFNRSAAFDMQQQVESFYERKVNGWTIKTVKAYSLDGKAIVMEEAKGKTARRILNDSPETYKSAMQAMAQVEQDALLGIKTENNPKPQELHANPDFHDGQVLIDKGSHTVTILDFGQAVTINNKEREYAMDLLAIIGKGYQPEQAAQILKQRTGVRLPQETLDNILASPDSMDVFTKLLGSMAQEGAKIPLPVVHWVLGMNRQRALGEKLDAPVDGKLRALAAMRMTGGSLETFNALRIAQRTPSQALRGCVLGPLGGWIGKVIMEQNLIDLAHGKISKPTLG